MITVVGIAGSLRERSYNRSLLRAAAQLAPEGLTIEIASIDGIPLYDGDAEKADGMPDAVTALKEKIAASDGLLLVTPEYNHSIPGVFKNVIDWLSRPPDDIPRVFGDRPVGLIGATPGRGGTTLAQAAWLPVLRTLGTRLYTGRQLQVGRASDVFDDDGALVDPKIRELLQKYVEGFTAFIG